MIKLALLAYVFFATILFELIAIGLVVSGMLSILLDWDS
jgi:hypothetical protein